MEYLKLRKLKKEYKNLFETYSPEDLAEQSLLIDLLVQLTNKYSILLTTSRRDIDKIRIRIEEVIQCETKNLYTRWGIIAVIVAAIITGIVAFLMALWNKSGS